MEKEDQSDASTSQEMLKIAGKPPEIKQRQERTPLKVSEGAWPYQLLDFRLLVCRIVGQ